jgi:type 1 glutamine amidotransferase
MTIEPKTTLLILRGLVHPTWLACRRLQRVLTAAPGFQFKHAGSLESLLRLETDRLSSIALYVHQRRISPAALQRLDDFIRHGGGLLAVHGAAASFKTEPDYHEILGGRFIGHGPVAEFEVLPSPGEDLFRGIEAFSLRDELYRHEFDPANKVHFFTQVGSEREPVVWTRNHDQGRICYCSLGHTSQTFHHPAVVEILRRGLLWVSGQGAPGRKST